MSIVKQILIRLFSICVQKLKRKSIKKTEYKLAWHKCLCAIVIFYILGQRINYSSCNHYSLSKILYLFKSDFFQTLSKLDLAQKI